MSDKHLKFNFHWRTYLDIIIGKCAAHNQAFIIENYGPEIDHENHR